MNADASAISADYASIVALSVRQVFGAVELTVSKDSKGNFNTSDVLMFMKGTLSSVISDRFFRDFVRSQKSPVMV